MKAALIPPTPELDRFGRGDFHLLLSHLITRGGKYEKHYKKERAKGAYLVLDNSAHEHGAGESAEKLFKQALALDAQEVVVPDVLENGPGTVEAATCALETWFEDDTKSMAYLNPALMYVPQGESVNDWVLCLRDLVRLHEYVARRYNLKRDFVIGLSKDYEVWDGGLLYLLDEYLWPLRQDLFQRGVRMHVHLLGWGRKLWDLEYLAQTHKWIRSTDSAKPFVFALENIVLDPEEDPPEYPKRPPKYFSKSFTLHQKKIATNNSMLFRAMASGSRTNTVIV